MPIENAVINLTSPPPNTFKNHSRINNPKTINAASNERVKKPPAHAFIKLISKMLRTKIFGISRYFTSLYMMSNDITV
ncbi:hypothetical protein TUM4438_40820 [Shewanella sairae]|uniref:Uncharacterized protein n=1 Tax=Shewanella sairae TaxID=190310 RepID=A0ABQ4PRS6_9GAMM|nr:hypothetical protein TUM4438_40820 [Shewanella sairae]